MRITPPIHYGIAPARVPVTTGAPRRNPTVPTTPPSSTSTSETNSAPVNPFASWVTCTLPPPATGSGSTGAPGSAVPVGIPRSYNQPSILMGGTVPGGGAATAPEGVASLLQQEATADPGLLNLAVLIQSGGLANAKYNHTLSYQLNYGGGLYNSAIPYTYALDDTTAAAIAAALGGQVVKGPAVNPAGSGAMGPIPQVNYIYYKGHLYNAGDVAGTSGYGLGSIITNLQRLFAGYDGGNGQMVYNSAQVGPMGQISNPTVKDGQSDGW